MRAAWHYLMAIGEVPSRRGIQAFLRANRGTAPRTDEVTAWLQAYQGRETDGSIFLRPYAGPIRGQAETNAGPASVEQNLMNSGVEDFTGPQRVHSGSSRDDLQGKVQDKLDYSSPPVSSKPTEPIAATPQAEPTPIVADELGEKRQRRADARKAARAAENHEREFAVDTADAGVSALEALPQADDTSQPLWVRQMRSTWLPTVLKASLSSLQPNARFALARYHAWRWANCRVDAGKNAAAAMKIASGLANIASDRRYGAMTVLEYIGLGDEAWATGGRRPMHSPWAAIGRIRVSA